MLKIDGSLVWFAELRTVSGAPVFGKSYGMGMGLAPSDISCAAVATKDFTLSRKGVETEARDIKSLPFMSEWTYDMMVALTRESNPSAVRRDSDMFDRR